MKINILFALSLCVLLSSCKQNDIAFYNEAPRLEFPSRTTQCVFDDVDYLNKVTEKEFEVEIRLIGKMLKEIKVYCLKGVENPNLGESMMPKLTFTSSYSFSINEYVSKAKFKSSRPDGLRGLRYAQLVFNVDDKAHQFGVGRQEFAKTDLVVSVDINQNGKRWVWNQELWGLYSANKYAFMIDNFGATFENIPQTKEKVAWIHERYIEYRKTNPALMDDEKEPSEIHFPVN